MRKVTITILKKKLWKIFSEFIRRRDSDWRGYAKCCTCGVIKQWKEGDAGHYVSRAHNSTLFDEQNVHFQCKRCNNNSGEPAKYTLFLIEEYGEGIIKELEKRQNQLKSFTIPELEEMIIEYKNKLKLLE